MKHLIFFYLLFFQSSVVAAQDIATTKEGKSIPLILNTNRDFITKLRSDEVKGSPMLSDHWLIGSVKFSNGKYVDSLLMQFNLETNKLLFRQQGLILEFVDTVMEAVLNYNEPGNAGQVVIRNYYSSAVTSNSPVYYLVLADGRKYQLLQLRTKKKVEQYIYGNNATVTYMETDELFIYESASGEIHKVKERKSSVQNALPAMRNEIEKICTEKALKIKDTGDLIVLVNLLNGL